MLILVKLEYVFNICKSLKKKSVTKYIPVVAELNFFEDIYDVIKIEVASRKWKLFPFTFDIYQRLIIRTAISRYNVNCLKIYYNWESLTQYLFKIRTEFNIATKIINIFKV